MEIFTKSVYFIKWCFEKEHGNILETHIFPKSAYTKKQNYHQLKFIHKHSLLTIYYVSHVQNKSEPEEVLGSVKSLTRKALNTLSGSRMVGIQEAVHDIMHLI